jgi:hypothetical protein
MEFLGDGGTADHPPALQHFYLQARAREIAGADQAVMARADDEGVPAHFTVYSTVTDFARLRGLSTSVPRASAV